MRHRFRNCPNLRKKWILVLLNLLAFFIFFLGMFFCAYSFINNLNFQVLGNSIPSSLLGILVAYLGIRYIFRMQSFEKEFLKDSSVFSWSNLH